MIFERLPRCGNEGPVSLARKSGRKRCHSSDLREQIICADAVQGTGWGCSLWDKMNIGHSALRSLGRLAGECLTTAHPEAAAGEMPPGDSLPVLGGHCVMARRGGSGHGGGQGRPSESCGI